MKILQILILLLLEIFVENNSLCDKTVESEIEHDLNELAGQSFALDYFLNWGSGTTNFLLELTKLSQKSISVLRNVLFLMEDVRFVILEDVQQEGQNFILLFLYRPECIYNCTLQQV